MADNTSSSTPLPWDILREIACYVIDTQGNRRNFMSVDKLFRSAIVDTPSFWTKITLCSLSSASYMVANAIDRINWLVERSQTMPLDITWNPRLFRDIDNERLARLFINRAPPERWRSLTIAPNPGISHQSILSSMFTGHSFSSLQVLAFTCSRSPIMVEFIRIIEDSAPTLSSITVSNALVLLTRPERPLPLRLIGTQTEVTFPGHGVALDEAGAIALLPNVERLIVLWEPQVMDIQLQSSAFISLTKLTIIHFHGHCLYKLHMPNLTDLCIKGSKDRKPDMRFPKLRCLSLWDTALELLPCFDAHLLELLHLKGDTLIIDSALDDPRYQLSPESLTIETEVSSTTLFLLLSLSPRLKHLHITVQYSIGLVERLFELLSMGSRSEDKGSKSWRLCKELQALHISVTSPRLTSDTDIIEDPARVLFRERSNGSLKGIHVEWTDGSSFRLGLTNQYANAFTKIEGSQLSML